MIRTNRLILRAPDPVDLPAVHGIFSNAKAMRYWSHPPHQTVQESRDALNKLISTHADTGLEFVIELDGLVIGRAGMWREAEIGYILHPAFWRRGFAYEALSALIPEIWVRYPDVSVVVAEIDPRNTGSARLLGKLGFLETHRAERTMMIADEWCDSVYYALSRPGIDST